MASQGTTAAAPGSGGERHIGASARSFDPEPFMRRALTWARAGLAHARPNPLVGAAVVRDGRLVGKGWHAVFGGPHAEVMALEDAGAKARRSTLVVTLEPCCHHGKTPPCTEAIVRAGVRRVFAATLDPNPCVGGRGARYLRRHGVDVEVGCCAPEALRLNEGYFSTQVRGRPWVTLKVAATLDGMLAAHDGTSRYISCPATLRLAHQLRFEHHAILVGRGTIEADDPQLNLRLVEGRNPVRVVLDTEGRLGARYRAFDTREAPTLWVTAPRLRQTRLKAALRGGAEHLEVPRSRSGHLDLRRLLRALAGRGLQSVLVEGGSEVATAFLKADLVDRLVVTVAPKLLGQGNRPWLGDLGIRSMSGIRTLRNPRVDVVGEDAVFQGEFTAAEDLLKGWEG